MYTKGPWRIENGELSKEHTLFGPPDESMPTGYILARVCHSNFFDDHGEEGQANARLMAAAPALLAALQEMMREYECTDDSDLNDAIILSRAAIAIAT